MNSSIPTSTSVEFVNVSPLNPLISKCEIKVLYTGLNRNRSFITKEVANKMAESLPGTPIVGQFMEKDFGDHGEEELEITENGLRFVKTTVPYGFIPTDARIWWQNFLDKDGVEREYLLTEGYLWTGRYPETKRVVETGNHQSMELDRERLKGEWTKNDNDEFEYFNINEAFFSALCILGEDVEPCFEGANIKKPGLLYSLDKDDFKSQLSNFMLDLKDALNIEGGNIVVEDNKETVLETPAIEETVVEPVVEEAPVAEPVEAEEFAKDDKKKKKEEEEASNESPEKKEEKEAPADKEKPDSEEDEEKKKKKAGKNFEVDEDDDEEEEEEEEETSPVDEADDESKSKKLFNLDEIEEYVQLSKDYLALSNKYEALVKEHEAIKPLVEKFQAEEDARVLAAKEDMIKEFSMLDEEDLAPIKENIANFSLDEIESKLCVIAVRKKVNFNLDDSANSDKEIEKPITTFNVDSVKDSTPAWLKAVENRQKHK